MIEHQIDERLCLIIGATAGIGKDTALKLAKYGLNMFIIYRNEDRA